MVENQNRKEMDMEHTHRILIEEDDTIAELAEEFAGIGISPTDALREGISDIRHEQSKAKKIYPQVGA